MPTGGISPPADAPRSRTRPGELLSPLGFALAAALEGVEVHVYFQGPAVRALTAGFKERLPGAQPAVQPPGPEGSPQGRARSGAGEAAPDPHLDRRLYVCGPSMRHFRVRKGDLVFDDLPIVEYATFMEVMRDANIFVSDAAGRRRPMLAAME